MIFLWRTRIRMRVQSYETRYEFFANSNSNEKNISSQNWIRE